jgi:DNA relaxase NicK
VKPLFEKRKPVLVDAGIDWITATALDKNSAGILEFRAHNLMRREVAMGQLEEPWGMSGFMGRSAGGVDWGASSDGCLVRLRSTQAAQNWRTVAEVASNVSRLDLQITVRPAEPIMKRLGQNYREVKRERRKSKRAPQGERRLHTENAGTCYVGRRQSNFFGRIYDKGAQTGLDHFKECLRYEVEVKGKPANRLCALLLRSSSELSLVAGQTVRYFRRKRITVPRLGQGLGAEPDVSALLSGAEWWQLQRTKGENQKSLEWLRSQVAPTVAHLVNSGLSTEVYSALALPNPALAHVGQLRQAG